MTRDDSACSSGGHVYNAVMFAAAFMAIVCGFGIFGAPPPVPAPSVVPFAGPKAPWLPRRQTQMKPNRMGVFDLKIWPPEPRAPQAFTLQAFARALTYLCGWMPTNRATRYATWILASSKLHGVDPTLLGALIYDASRCRPRMKASAGIGLARISLKMHLNHFKGRSYHYWIKEGGGWKPLHKTISEHLFYEGSLRHAKANIAFAAAFLAVFQAQCPAIDGAFRSVRHRHPVSHFVWGDRVRGTDAEDRILTARRRLIGYLKGSKPKVYGHFPGLKLVSPLDGAPRKLTSKVGDLRDGGRRRHRGIDFQSYEGEPVRAVAEGLVIAAGVDRRGAPIRNLKPKQAGRLPRGSLAPGGLVVLIRHPGGLVTANLHLRDYVVIKGQLVKRGQLIGHVGRTGIRAGAAHLHFELRFDGKRIDPIPFLDKLVISPMRTYRGRMLHYEERRRRRR